MPADLPLIIALWSGGLTIGGAGLAMMVSAVVASIRKKAKPVDPLGALFGLAVLAGVPVILILFVGLFASAALIGLGAPPVTYLFVAAAACLSFARSLNRPSYGMEGCTKTFALMWSAYAAVWGGVSFVILAGPHWIAAEGPTLAWLRPVLVAALYAAAFAGVTDKKRRTWGRFLGALVFLSAFAAVLFLPVEAGLVGRWLPASDWLRFPLVALIAALLIASLPLILNLRSSPAVRRSRRREWPSKAGRLSLILIPAGLLWAAARLVTGAL
jgi:hypothetical protein